MGAVVVTASSISADTPAQSERTPSQASPSGLREVPVALRINGQERQLQLEPRVTLLDALRKNLRLTCGYLVLRKAAITASVERAQLPLTVAA